MKIKYVFLLLFFLLFVGVFAEDCAYLQDPKKSFADNDYEGRFNYYYPFYLCEENNPIHKDATDYVQSIKKIKGKDMGAVVHDIGNTLCRGYFGECSKESLYGRFLTSCVTARARSIEAMAKKVGNKKPSTAESISTEFLADSYVGCPNLAENYILAYKEVAMAEAGRYHQKTIESSNQKYQEKSKEKIDKLSGIFGTFLKIFSNIARSFQGFTKQVYKV